MYFLLLELHGWGRGSLAYLRFAVRRLYGRKVFS